MLGPNNRLYAPDDLVWRVDRELAVLAGGGRALLLQLAHPKVAAGVAQHSDFAGDAVGRLRRTLRAMWTIGFDDGPAALAALKRIQVVHTRVHGEICRDAEAIPRGTRYSALDPELLFWVHATLVDSGLQTYDRFVRPLTASDCADYYDQTRKLAVLFGVPEPYTPPTWDAFRAYMDHMLADGSVTVGPTARELAQQVLAPRPLVLRLAAPLSAFLATGLLPADIRMQYGFSWTSRDERRLKALAWLVRHLLPVVPEPIRIVPNARAGERKLARR